MKSEAECKKVSDREEGVVIEVVRSSVVPVPCRVPQTKKDPFGTRFGFRESLATAIAVHDIGYSQHAYVVI
jgi:hypothetical protein